MVDIEKIDKKYESKNPIGEFSKTASRFANDLVELSELQVKLAKSDLEEVLHRSIGSLVVAVIGTTLLLASLPVLLFGLASSLAWYCEIDPWITQVAIGGGVATLSLVTVILASRRLLRQQKTFQRSGSELKKNMEWVKSIIRSRA